MGKPILMLREIGKDFGATVALKSLSCSVSAGEIVGLLGPNGSGKTTTMRLLMGLLRPTRGEASFEDLDCTRDSRRVKERIGFTPDEPAFYDFLTGRETLTFALQVRAIPLDDAWKRLTPLVTQLDFDEFLDVAVGGYSHGTKKKLALLLALAHSPALLLLDEPTNGLDSLMAARVRTMLKEYANHGGAVIVSTHLLAMAELLCDRVIILHHGALLAEGSPADVKAKADVVTGTLEDAFLALVK